MPPRRGILALALLLLSVVISFTARHGLLVEARRAGALLAGGNRDVLAASLAVFVLVPLASALTWCCALGGAFDACCCYGVGSLVNAFVPARAGDAVRFALFARLLDGVPKRALALRFGGLEAIRLAVFGSLAVAYVLPWLGAVLAGAAVTGFALRGRHRLGLAVGFSVAVKVAAFAVALDALGVASPVAAALRIVPALEVAATVPLTPGNAAFATLASSAALGAGGMRISSGLALGVALHVLETAGSICFGLGSLAALVARRARWGQVLQSRNPLTRLAARLA